MVDSPQLSSLLEGPSFVLSPQNRSSSSLSLSSNDSSALSFASTVGEGEEIFGGANLVVDVFCTNTSQMLTMDFPAASTGWMYRADVGGYTHHRLDHIDSSVFVMRRTTCRSKDSSCRNCIMKRKWRRECSKPHYDFFVTFPGEVPGDILYSRRACDMNEINDRLRCLPKTFSQRKHVLNATEVETTLTKIRSEIRSFVSIAPNCESSESALEEDETAFLNLLGQALGMETTKKAPSAVQPTDVEERDGVKTMNAPSPYTDDQNIASTVYCELIAYVSHYDVQNDAVIPSSWIDHCMERLSSHFPPFQTPNSELTKLQQLLCGTVGGSMIVKYDIVSWLKLIPRCDDAVVLSIAFFVPFNVDMQNDILNAPLLPLFLKVGNHVLYDDIAAAKQECALNVSPFLVVVSQMKRGALTEGRRILPISIVS